MPKDRRSSSRDNCRTSPYSCCYRNADSKRPRTPTLPIGDENEWEEARCPICMEHPHNAVLLLCSSREKGCRPYMCDTSSRHSNCLDQFRRSFKEGEETKLVCPLCRGEINGWIVVDPARHFMNSKTRSCSMGTCDFGGNYLQLRKHARREHPRVRPTDVDPEREREWKILEEDMEQQEMLSMQFQLDEYDEAIEELMDGVLDLGSPIWDYDYDLDFMHSFEAEFESLFPIFDMTENASLFLDDWDNMFASSSSHEPESGRSRGTTRNARTTRSRTNTRHLQRSTSQSNSRNRQEQVTTLVDFHELSSNLP